MFWSDNRDASGSTDRFSLCQRNNKKQTFYRQLDAAWPSESLFYNDEMLGVSPSSRLSCARLSSFSAREGSAMLRLRAAEHAGRGSYLGGGFLVSHGRLFDETLDFHVPVPTRNHHPGPPEAHRHFHFSALVPTRSKKGDVRGRKTSPVNGGGGEKELPQVESVSVEGEDEETRQEEFLKQGETVSTRCDELQSLKSRGCKDQMIENPRGEQRVLQNKM
ncbi:unnamed protein product, partial [Lampetra planeri]